MYIQSDRYAAEKPRIESCTQAEERYYLEWKGSDVSDTPEVFTKYPLFVRGFKTEKSAYKALKKAATARNIAHESYRVSRVTRIIEIKTTTSVEVLGE